MMKLFFGAWALYALLFIVMPFKFPPSGNMAALGVILAFALSVLVAYWLIVRAPVARSFQIDLPPKGFHLLLWTSIGLSVLGIALLFYDRIVIQGIDFSYGLAYARAQWTDLGQGRTVPSSAFSVIGYLIGSSYFVALVMAFDRLTLVSRRELALLLAAVFGLAMANSAITGGRTTLLLLVAFSIAVLALRTGGSLMTVMRGRYFQRGGLLLAVVMLAYVTYVTFDRAWNAYISMDTYLLEAAEFLKLDLSEWYRIHLNDSALREVTSPLVFIGAYIVHSYAILCEIVQHPGEDKVIVFGHLFGLMAKLGWVDAPQSDWFLSGRFPTLPGALFHQFGLAGVVGGGAVLGVLSGLGRRCYLAVPGFVLFQGFQACTAVILILSPLLFAADLMIFPFIVIGFVIVSALQLVIVTARAGAR